MAQTAQLVHELAAGIVDSTGAVVSSGLARFYQPGTLVAITVYSDAQATTPLSQPVTLSAGGTATVYTAVPARMILKKSDDATTVLDANVNTQLAGAVYIKNANVNSGAETTLDALLSSSSSNFAGYLESSGATIRSYQSRLQDQEVSLEDFGATGDGVTDDTVAIQLAFDHCGSTGKDLLVPAATYLISSAISLASYTKKFNIRGCGAKASIIKQSGTAANGLTLSYGSSTDWGAEIRAVGFTCSTTSSGAAVSASNANNLTLRDCEFALFRTGVGASGSTGVVVERCTVLSTDGNASAQGIIAGSGSRVDRCIVTGTSNNGTGVTVGADSHVSEVAASGWATGIGCTATDVRVRGGKVTVSGSNNGVVLTGDNSVASDVFVSGGALGFNITGQYSSVASCTASGCTTTAFSLAGSYGAATASRAVAMPANSTSFSLAASYCSATACVASASSTTSTTGFSLGAAGCATTASSATGCATGLSLGAFADLRAVGNTLSSNTTDISVNASATNYTLTGNAYTTLTDNSKQFNQGLKAQRLPAAYNVQTVNTAAANVTPIVGSSAITVNNIGCVYTGGATTLTINNTATTGVQDGDLLFLQIIANTATTGNITVAWGAQYVRNHTAINGGAIPGIVLTGATGDGIFAIFQWDSGTSKWCGVLSTKNNPVLG